MAIAIVIQEFIQIVYKAYLLTMTLLFFMVLIWNFIFISSGRKVPSTAGIILSIAKTKEELEVIMNEDPFCIHKLANFKLVEFLTSQTHPEFKKMLKAL